MQELYKYSILEEKHVILQMGSSSAMKKKEGNFNQGFSRLDMHLMKIFKYFRSFEQAQTFKISKKKEGFFQKHNYTAQKVGEFLSPSQADSTLPVLSLSGIFQVSLPSKEEKETEKLIFI